METIKREAITPAQLNWMKENRNAKPTDTSIYTLATPPVVILPTEQHLGSPAKPVVDVDDYVLKGQLIAKATGLISANIHAPTSGTVMAIAQRSIKFNESKRGTCIVIECDGKDEWVDLNPSIDFQQESRDDLLAKIREAGIVDIDGEGLPVHISLNPKKPINTIIINACHWNDADNTDDIALLNYANDIVTGLKIIRQVLDQPKRTVIAVEAGKEHVANAIFSAIEAARLINCEVKLCDEAAAGPDRQSLIEHLTGQELNHDGLPVNIGCICFNASTLYAVYRAVCKGEPAVSQLIQAQGAGFDLQQTLSVPLGTPMSYILKQQGFDQDDNFILRINNIHTGSELKHDESPVNKLINSLWSIPRHQNIIRQEHEALGSLRASNNEELEFFDSQGGEKPAATDKASEAEPDPIEEIIANASIDETPQTSAADNAGKGTQYLPNSRDLAPESETADASADDVEQSSAESAVKSEAASPEAITPQASSEMSAKNAASEPEDTNQGLNDSGEESDQPVAQPANQSPEEKLEDVGNIKGETSSPADVKQAQNPADMTMRSQNIFRLQNQLKNLEDQLDDIDPNDFDSAEALLLSINVVIEKINAAKSIREKEIDSEVNPDANNQTLLQFMGSLQNRLSLAQDVMSKKDRANASTQLAIKQALFQLESKLDNALDDIDQE